MKLKLFTVNHRFLSTPDQIEATLAIESELFTGRESGEITIVIKHPQPKSLTLDEIEQLAITKALEALK